MNHRNHRESSYLRAYKAPVIRLLSSVVCPLSSALYICREPSTNHLLFMQNKPNFRKAKMNVNAFSQKDYENETTFRPKKTNPNKPNSPPILKISVLNFDNLYKILTTYEISF